MKLKLLINKKSFYHLKWNPKKEWMKETPITRINSMRSEYMTNFNQMKTKKLMMTNLKTKRKMRKEGL